MTQYICIKNRQYYTEHKPKIGDVYLVLPPMKQELQWNLYEKSDHHVSGLRYILGLPSDIFLDYVQYNTAYFLYRCIVSFYYSFNFFISKLFQRYK